ncbi:MAG: hypothetical protein HC790_08905 [Acaryochloridaceae cyanobacterium CSU_3_4]|nr:hypothetical protein [Acaryochloridaceae cyanobacterium CSU_3_4]
MRTGYFKVDRQFRAIAKTSNQSVYTHLGHFAAGFKRQFGMTPSECLAGRQGMQ